MLVKHEFLCKRDATPQPDRVSGGSAGLPTALLEKASRRLGFAALIYAAVYLLAYGSARLTQDFAQQWGYSGIYPADVTASAFILLSVGFFFVVRSGKIDKSLLLDLGLVYQVFGGAGIEISMLFMPEWPAGIDSGLLSWSCVWIVMFPMLVPTTPGKTLIAALATASMRPLMYLLAVAGALDPLPGAVVFSLVFPNYICVGIAVVGSRVVYGLGRDINRAQQMGSYQLVELLGVGGMGEVWKAEHRMLARPAAIKLIRSDGGGSGSRQTSDGNLKRFEREVQATALLRSPHTVQVYDYGLAEDRTFYYVMELLDGVSLEELIKKHGPLPPERVVHILRHACHSLAEAHERDLIHRDLKPANIFLCRQGLEFDFVKVLDFGLVKHTGEQVEGELGITQIGTFIGTPAYGSPEMAAGSEVVEATSDIYSLACVAYWLLTGRTVFKAPSLPMMLVKHLNEDPRPPSGYAKQVVPEALDEVILECLSKDPKDRPQSAAALDSRLEQLEHSASWTQERARDWWIRHVASKPR
jgi:serine/threonine-protein kinase